jgi:hypothetical protein
MSEQAGPDPRAERDGRLLTDDEQFAEVLRVAHKAQHPAGAITAVRAAHPQDFDLLLKGMIFMAPIFAPDLNRILLTEYVEALYCLARYAAFAAPVRKYAADIQLLQQSNGRPN